jgi:hypothetical protein
MKFFKEILYCPQCGQPVDVNHGSYVCQNIITLPDGTTRECRKNLLLQKKEVKQITRHKNAVANIGLAVTAGPIAILIGIVLFVAVLVPAIVNGFLGSPGTQGCGASFAVILIAGSMIGVFGLATGIGKKGAKIILSFLKKIFGDW